MFEQEKPTQVAAYVRVSTETQARTGESLNVQRQRIEDEVNRRGWRIAHYFTDAGLSGRHDRRPAFQSMIDAAADGLFDAVMVTRLSRFGRNAREVLNYTEILKEAGVTFISIGDGIDSATRMGQFYLAILSAFAQLEAETLSERMQDSKMARWRERRIFLGRPPYGYRWNSDAQRLEIIENEAETYRRIVEMYVDAGYSFLHIAERLNREGIPTQRGNEWTTATLSNLLDNTTHWGRCVVNRRAPASERIVFVCPPIINKVLWDRVQERRQFNKRKSKRVTHARAFYLRDVLRCGRCGGKINRVSGAKRDDGTRPRYYACHWAKTSDRQLANAQRARCELPHLKAQDLEDEIWSELLAPLLTPNRLGALVDPAAHRKKITAAQRRVAARRAEIVKAERAQARLFSLFEDGRFDADALHERLNEIDVSLVTARGRLESALEDHDAAVRAHENDAALRTFLDDRRGFLHQLARGLRALGPDDRKRVVEALLDGPVRVTHARDVEFARRWDMAIFQALIREGKLGGDNGPSGGGAHGGGAPFEKNAQDLFSLIDH